MRELKVRAWDIEAEEYLPISDGKCDGVIGISADGVWVLWLEDGEITRFKNGRSSILEQYTGLKDKNGKKIYEGDILKVRGRAYVVKFDNYGQFYMENKNYHWIENWYSFRSVDIWCAEGILVEIIGNIHENQELLDVKEEG